MPLLRAPVSRRIAAGHLTRGARLAYPRRIRRSYVMDGVPNIRVRLTSNSSTVSRQLWFGDSGVEDHFCLLMPPSTLIDIDVQDD